MKLFARWTHRPITHGPITQRPGKAHCQAQPDTHPTPASSQDEAPPHGCGWFESSHELGHGLMVTEHDSPDRVAQALPLDSWLELWLAWQRSRAASGPPRGASSAA